MTGHEETKEGEKVATTRRKTLKLMTTLSVLFGIGSLAPLLKAITPITLKIPEWPRLKIANINEIKPATWYLFSYPTENIPCLLVKLGKPVPDGVGPDKDVVAYVMICQHARYYGTIYLPPGEKRDPGKLSYLKTVPPTILDLYPEKNLLYCPAHAGFYDLENAGSVLSGPPFCSLCRVVLDYEEETGDVYVMGLAPPAPAVPGVTQCSTNPDELKRILLGKKLVSEIKLEERV